MEEKYTKTDIPEAVDRLGINEDIIKSIIKKVLDGNELDLAEKAFQEGDLAESKLHIHTIKGAGKNLGLTGLAQLALDIETKIIEDSFLDMELLKQMRTIWEELKSEFC